MSIERVNYFDGQYLRVEDFADEQTYQIAMRRRHNISLHTWGIVQGLEPQLVEGSLYVSAGLAIDGFGRELILETQQPLPAQSFVDFDTNELQVWIDYATVRAMSPPKGLAFCKEGQQEQFYRISEEARVRFAKPNVNSTPRLPGGVLSTDVGFDATRQAPEDRNWPVFLGTVKADPKNPDQPYSIDLSKRPYAGLTGESVVAPSGGSRLQVGSEVPGDSNRFAVFIPADDKSPRLAIQEDGTFNVRGDTTLQGDLTISGGALEIGVGPAISPQPWRIYRVQQRDAAGSAQNQLRIEMGGGGTGNNQIVFGAWSQKDSAFQECLTIADDGTVTVNGNLVIKGKLYVNPENIVPGQLSKEAMAYVASGALTSVGLGSLPNRMSQATQPTSAKPTSGQSQPGPVNEARLREAATTIAQSSPEHLRTLAGLIKGEFSDVAGKLKKILED